MENDLLLVKRPMTIYLIFMVAAKNPVDPRVGTVEVILLAPPTRFDYSAAMPAPGKAGTSLPALTPVPCSWLLFCRI
jgi:hypothetical protein